MPGVVKAAVRDGQVMAGTCPPRTTADWQPGSIADGSGLESQVRKVLLRTCRSPVPADGHKPTGNGGCGAVRFLDLRGLRACSADQASTWILAAFNPRFSITNARPQHCLPYRCLAASPGAINDADGVPPSGTQAPEGGEPHHTAADESCRITLRALSARVGRQRADEPNAAAAA